MRQYVSIADIKRECNEVNQSMSVGSEKSRILHRLNSAKYYLRHKDRCRESTKQYIQRNPEKRKESYNNSQRKAFKNNPEMFRTRWRLWRRNNPEKIKQYNYNSYWKDPELNKRRTRQWYDKKGLEWYREYRKENPTSGHKDPMTTRAMNQARKRDKNTCQWANCDKTFRECSIHVHHILPCSKYPQFAASDWNLICYCVDHHITYHEKYWKMRNSNSHKQAYHLLEGFRRR